MWAEKYRPRKITDFLSNEIQVRTFLKFACATKKTNLLIHGPPGTGKTSCIFTGYGNLFSFIKRKNIMDFNGIDKLGIKKIKKEFKPFANAKFSGLGEGKVIILDDADFFTFSGQLALRENLEKCYVDLNIWLACNFLSKINPTIVSRCIVIKFMHVSPLHSVIRLKEIGEKEKISLYFEFLEDIVSFGNGDIRKSINELFIKKFSLKYEFILPDFEKGFIPKKLTDKLKESMTKDRRLIFQKKNYMICQARSCNLMYIRQKISSDLHGSTIQNMLQKSSYHLIRYQTINRKAFYSKFINSKNKNSNPKKKRLSVCN